MLVITCYNCNQWGLQTNLPSGKRLHSYWSHGPVEIVDFPIKKNMVISSSWFVNVLSKRLPEAIADMADLTSRDLDPLDLVGGIPTPLKNINQWEGWHPMYEMVNKKCLKPPTSLLPTLKTTSLTSINHRSTAIFHSYCGWASKIRITSLKRW